MADSPTAYAQSHVESHHLQQPPIHTSIPTPGIARKYCGTRVPDVVVGWWIMKVGAKASVSNHRCYSFSHKGKLEVKDIYGPHRSGRRQKSPTNGIIVAKWLFL